MFAKYWVPPHISWSLILKIFGHIIFAFSTIILLLYFERMILFYICPLSLFSAIKLSHLCPKCISVNINHKNEENYHLKSHNFLLGNRKFFHKISFHYCCFGQREERESGRVTLSSFFLILQTIIHQTRPNVFRCADGYYL